MLEWPKLQANVQLLKSLVYKDQALLNQFAELSSCETMITALLSIEFQKPA